MKAYREVAPRDVRPGDEVLDSGDRLVTVAERPWWDQGMKCWLIPVGAGRFLTCENDLTVSVKRKGAHHA